MVSTRSMASERMSEAVQMPLLVSLQREMAEIRRRSKEVSRKNEDEILALRKENEEMRMKLEEGRPLLDRPILSVDTSPLLPTPRQLRRQRTNFTHRRFWQRVISEQVGPYDRYPALDSPTFTETIIGVPLSDKWKDFIRDRYDGTTDPNEHMDVYTMHMSLYTSEDAVLYWVFPTLLKGGTLSWFTKLPPNSIHSFTTLVSKFETQFATSRPHHLTSITLVGICQEKGESPGSFSNPSTIK